jgi:tetratricopeptide (TPR) repeat protein
MQDTELRLQLLIMCNYRCILELHAISTKISDGGGRFEITMPAHSRESLLKETSVDASKYFNLLSNVAAEYSVCSREADKKSIHDAIRDTIGFDALNRSIFSVICNWIIGQLQALTSEMKVTNPLGSVQRLKAMGTVLYEMGRYSEALHVFQDAAQVYACFRKAAPLSFGTDISSLDAEIDRQIIRAHVYLGQYDLAQNCYDQMVKKKSVTSNTLSSRLLGFDLSALVGDASDSDADDFDVIGTWDHLHFYHMLLFADSDDPEFAQACNTHIGKKQMAPETVTGTDFDWGVLQNAVDDPLLYLLLKQTSFQLKINRLPAAHPWVALAMLHLAHAHFEVDQFVEALALLQNTLPFLRRLPPLHPNTILALLLLSACLMQHGDLDLATSSAEEAMAMCKTHESCRRIPVPVEIERAAEEAVAILQDEEFRLNVNSLDHANVRSSCVARYVAVMKKIGTDEARMERVIINRGRDAADRMMEKLLPNVQSKMDEECSAKGEPKFDLYVPSSFAFTDAFLFTDCIFQAPTAETP